MRAVKFVFFALGLIALIGGAFFSYVLLAPVTADNVEFRLTSVCAMGTTALRLSDAAAEEMERLTKASCACLSHRLVNEAGPDAAAKATEAARKLGLFAIKWKWRQGAKEDSGPLLKSFSVKDRILQEFSERYVNAANACEGEPV